MFTHKSRNIIKNETEDGSQFFEEEIKTLYSKVYILSENKVNYSFEFPIYTDILAKIGGLSKSLFFILGIIGIANNERKLIGKNIRNLYFISN